MRASKAAEQNGVPDHLNSPNYFLLFSDDWGTPFLLRRFEVLVYYAYMP